MYPCGYGYYPNEFNNNGYVIEVVRYINSTLVHIGNLNKKFNRKVDACNFYKTRFPHMPSIDQLTSLKSKIDPKTNLAYIIRDDYGVECNIPLF